MNRRRFHHIKLKGLIKDCTYEISSPIEGDEVLTMTGEDLMTTGLTFESSSSAAYAVFFSAVK
ncbi:MAG: hypothetical protein ACLVKR_03720 [Lachnospiraceae bacterium]